MTRKEAIQTESMLSRLATLLTEHEPAPASGIAVGYDFNRAREDAESLRRISMTLHRWHELECGTDAGHVERDEASGKPYWYPSNRFADTGRVPRYSTPDREKGALARLARIMSRYPSLQAYVQTDPRGCALYILRPGDVPAGEKAESYYSRGIAVYK